MDEETQKIVHNYFNHNYTIKETLPDLQTPERKNITPLIIEKYDKTNIEDELTKT